MTRMREIIIKRVETKEELEDFILFPNELYADCPYYVPDLDMDIQHMFNPKKNAGLEFSEIQAFIAFNREGKLLGRIAGIINHHANENGYVKKEFNLRTKKLTNKDIYKHHYGHKIFHLLNEAYAPIFGFTELTDKQTIDIKVAKSLY